MFSTFQVFTDLKGESFDLSGGLAPERSKRLLLSIAGQDFKSLLSGSLRMTLSKGKPESK
jgi:hypothetical protein